MSEVSEVGEERSEERRGAGGGGVHMLGSV